jgi:molecular chaperone HscB
MCSHDGAGAVVDHFANLGIQRAFALDEAALRADYLRLMAAHHPDRHTRESSVEQAGSADRSADVTRAFSVLSRRHSRAVHLLELLGAPLIEETSGTALLGPEFLSDVMEARSEVDDPDTIADRLRQLRTENERSMRAIHVELEDAFARLTRAGDGLRAAADNGVNGISDELQAARVLTAKLGYLQRIDDVAADRLDREEERSAS